MKAEKVALQFLERKMNKDERLNKMLHYVLGKSNILKFLLAWHGYKNYVKDLPLGNCSGCRNHNASVWRLRL